MVNLNEITPTFLVEGDNIDEINKQVLSLIIDKGKDINFGDKTEVKQAREVFMVVHIYGKAIKELIKGKIPKSANFGTMSTAEFQKSFVTLETNPTGFIYSYPQIAKEYPKSGHKSDLFVFNSEAEIHHHIAYDTEYDVMYNKYRECVNPDGTINQLEISRIMLEEDKKRDLQSNRNMGVIYHPYMWDMKEKPCWNWYQVRYLGNGNISLRVLFRSHDYGDAVFPNMSGLLYCFDEIVAKPNGCKITELFVISASAHGYEHSSQDIENKTGLKWNKKNKVQG